MLVGAIPQAGAQNAGEVDRLLLQPAVDGDPSNPPRFRQPERARRESGPLPTGDATNLQYRPAIGVGITGFDSTNADRRKGKYAAKAKPRSASSVVIRQVPLAAASRQNQAQRPVMPSADYAPAGAAGTPAPPRRRGSVRDEDPFAPTGIQVGAFNLRPAVELSGAFDSNATRSSSAKPSWYSVVTPELLVNSNWARHALTANLRGSVTSYEDTKDLNRPEVDAKVNGRIDVTGTTRLDLEARYLLGTDNPGSPDIQANIARIPIFTTLGATAGLTQRFNRFDLTVKTGVDRIVYQDSHFVDGSTSSNADRDYIRYNAALRLGYELTPGVKPFADLAFDSRTHDLPLDVTGVSRDSRGLSAKGGTTFEISRILTGEASIGYLARDYKDPALPSFGGLLLDGSLLWVASALTTAKLSATTSVGESTVAGVSGVFTRTVSLEVDHAFRRWLTATGKFTFGTDDYVGTTRLDQRYAVSALLTYKLSRELWLKAEYRHLWLSSSASTANYAADVLLVGVRLQR